MALDSLRDTFGKPHRLPNSLNFVFPVGNAGNQLSWMIINGSPTKAFGDDSCINSILCHITL